LDGAGLCDDLHGKEGKATQVVALDLHSSRLLHPVDQLSSDCFVSERGVALQEAEEENQLAETRIDGDRPHVSTDWRVEVQEQAWALLGGAD